MTYSLRRSLTLAFCALLILPGSAVATTRTVTKIADTDDGGCAAMNCSLRDAVKYSDVGDTVNLPAGHYTLGMGVIPIAHDLTILGAGATTTTIDGNDASTVFTTQNLVSMSDLTVTKGHVTGSSAAGGGIANSGDLTLTRVTLSDNIAESASGGVPQGGGVFNSGRLIVVDSKLTGNKAETDNGGGVPEGGGIYNAAHAVTTVTRSTLSGNAASILAGGGGVPEGGAIASDGAEVDVVDSTISGNTASIAGGAGGVPLGGGLHVGVGTFKVSGTKITGNSAVSEDASVPEGGGIASDGDFTLTTSTVSGNSSTSTANGVSYGAGVAALDGTFTIDSTTISGNTSTAGTSGTAYGGGFYSAPAVTLTNTTISSNTATAGGSTSGGGIYISGASAVLTLVNSTLAANTAQGTGAGGNIDAASSAKANLKNTIVAVGTASTGPNCAGGSLIVSQGHNLDSRNDCGFNATGDLRNSDPKLGPLHDNGGPVQTRALLAGSPAIDAGTGSGCPKTDARGVARPQGAACDMGAFESAPPVVTTGTASAVTTTTATVAGTLVPNLSNATWQFEYGTTTAYGSATPTQSAGAGTAAIPVTADLAGLTPATTYHYRLVATNADGTGTGADETFTTGAVPLAPPPVAPVLSNLTLSPVAFLAAPSGPSIARARYGTRVTYSDSEAATTTFSVLQTKPGVRRGSRCVAPPRHAKRGLKRCKRTVVAGRFAHTDAAGINTFRFRGRLHGRKLKPGRYTLRAVAKAGNLTGKPVSARFQIKPAKKKK